jgi:glycosyltransferase involved in cell wall biosynthesis
MASGLPVITTRVAGIPSLIEEGRNGLFLDMATGGSVAAAVNRLIGDASLRRKLIQGGYDTARAHTVDAQAAEMMAVVAKRLGVELRRTATKPAA